MSLIQRKARPLTRDSDSLRDDRLFIVACDDTCAPEQYFNFFKITRVHIHVVPTKDGTSAARHVLNRLLEFEYDEDDERWLVLDVDHYTKGEHIKGFLSAIKRARRHGIKVALSKPCFELWLLLHHQDETTVSTLSNAGKVAEALRSKIGQYDKTNLKLAHYPLLSVAEAALRAQRLDQIVAGGDIPGSNTTRIYLLLKAIVREALPSQLPEELRILKTNL
jgi:hypothetical protein